MSVNAATMCRTIKLDVTIFQAEAVPVPVTCPLRFAKGKLRAHITDELDDLPVVGFLTRLRLRVSRFTCSNAWQEIE
ncbi:hypothetical protein WG915_05485 [Corynebacterium sp. H128]|uniref:hypothetical protein n=1 Tax=unclassified Corynebacterium TaxID=2624378 RepID=UPI0030A1D909